MWLVMVLISLCLPYLLATLPPHTHTLKGVDTPIGAHPPVTDSRMDMNITHIVEDKVEGHLDSPETHTQMRFS